MTISGLLWAPKMIAHMAVALEIQNHPLGMYALACFCQLDVSCVVEPDANVVAREHT